MDSVVVFDCYSIQLNNSLWLWSHMNLASSWSYKVSNEVEDESEKNRENSIMLSPCQWPDQSLFPTHVPPSCENQMGRRCHFDDVVPR